MSSRIVIIPGRPKGYQEVKCAACGYLAYVSAEELVIPNQGGRYSSGRAYVSCGNADCSCQISIPATCIPDDVSEKMCCKEK